MDPFKVLSEDIHRFILQHFDGNEIKKLSLVSRLWHDVTGSSRNCMKKLIYRVDKQLQLEVLKHTTTRQYENFKVTPYGLLQKLTEVLGDFYVRNMWINEVCEKELDHSGYIRLIQSFAQSVEYLQIGDIATKNSSSRSTIAIDFPKLRKLHCSFTNRAAFSILLGNNPNLESVILSYDSLAIDEDELLQHDNIIIKFLAKNSQKIQNLWLLHLEKLFLYDISSKVSNLKHFTFTTNFQSSPPHARENFIKLIKSQGSFDSLNMMGCRDKKILTQLWNESIKFKKLFVIDCNFHEDLFSYDLQRNSFVIEIDFYLTSSVHVLFFLQKAPNIAEFKVRQLSKQLLEYSLRHLRCLKVIKFQSIDTDALKYFNEQKTVLNGSVKLKELDFFEYLNIDKK